MFVMSCRVGWYLESPYFYSSPLSATQPIASEVARGPHARSELTGSTAGRPRGGRARHLLVSPACVAPNCRGGGRRPRAGDEERCLSAQGCRVPVSLTPSPTPPVGGARSAWAPGPCGARPLLGTVSSPHLSPQSPGAVEEAVLCRGQLCGLPV